jgi:hypothetical protein
MILDQFRPSPAARLARASCEVDALRALARSEALEARRALTWEEMSAHRRRANVLAHKAMELENLLKDKE